MYAGQDISPVFDIADYIEANLDPQKQYRVAEVNKVVEQAYEQKRSEIANVSKQPITTLAIQLLIFGFDQHGTAHVSYVSGLDGVVRRAGSPGWYAIGIGHVRR